MIKKKDLDKGLRAYSKQINRIYQLIKKNGGKLSDEQFDKFFSEEPDELWSVDRHSFILSSVWNRNPSQKWLHLLLFMVEYGFINRTLHRGKRKDEVTYYLKEL